MRIFHLRVIQENNHLVIETYQLHIKTGEDEPEVYRYNVDTKTIQETMLDNFIHSDKDEVIKALARTQKPTLDGEIIFKDRTYRCSLSTVNYSIAYDSQLALDLLSTLVDFCTTRQYNYNIVSQNSFASIISTNPDNKPSGTFEQFIAGTRVINECHEIASALADTILNMEPKLPAYQPLFDAIESIKRFLAKNPAATFADCLTTKDRLGILSAPDYYQAASTQTSIDRVKYISAIAKKHIKDGKSKDLNQLIEHFLVTAKRNLYAPAIGKIAADGGKYKWNYTEWDLLSSAEFRLRNDGRMSILLANNHGYKRTYAPGARLHDIIEAEFTCLGKIIGLEFAPDTNFHREMIFTPECTEQLKARGLHHTVDYVKQLLKVQNVNDLFRQGKINQFDKKGQPSQLFAIPRDVLTMFLEYAFPKEHSGLDFMEKEKCKALAWGGESRNLFQMFKPVDPVTPMEICQDEKPNALNAK